MSFRHQRIRRTSGAPFVCGETFSVARTVEDVPTARTLASVVLTIKADPTDGDDDAIVQKTITTSAVGGTGQITDDATDDEEGAFTFEFTEADSDNTASATKMGPNRTYWYNMVVVFDNDDESVYEEGTIKLTRNFKDTA